VHAVVPESRVTLDSALLRENVIVLALEVGTDLAKRALIVDLVTEARRVNDRQADTGPFLVQLKLDSRRLDAHALLEMGGGWVIAVLALHHAAAAEGVDEGCAAGT